MLISQLQAAFDIQHCIWFNECVPLFWILKAMDCKDRFHGIPQCRHTFGILKKSLPIVLGEGLLESRGKKGINCLCHMNLRVRV